jgi:hypothetical protein
MFPERGIGLFHLIIIFESTPETLPPDIYKPTSPGMNNKNILIAVISLLLFVSNSRAQIRDVKWEPFLQHPCYKGLSVSVLNMGWSNDVKTYLWGVRIKNNYNTAVSFRYLLDVGDEKKNLTKNYYEAAYRLKPGDSLTNGDDALRGIIFKTSSSEWTVMIGDVCFDGMRCGGEDDCYADCDVVARKVNQPCGLEAHTSTKKNEKPNEVINEDDQDIKPGYYTLDENKSFIIKVEKGEKKLTIIGLYGGLKVGNKISLGEVTPGIYKSRIDKWGLIVTSTYLSTRKFSFIETDSNGITKTNAAFTYKDSIVKQENMPAPVTENKVPSTSCELSGEWQRAEGKGYGNSSPVYATIKTTSDGISWSCPYSNEYGIFKKISANTYRWDPDPAMEVIMQLLNAKKAILL